MNCKVSKMKADNLLVLMTLIGVVVGIIVGLPLRQQQLSQDAIIWIGLPGEMYMRSLKMVIMPFIVCGIVSGTASLDPKCNGRISIISLAYIIVTNSLACIIPILLAVLLRLGQGADIEFESIKNNIGETTTMETGDIFADLIRNLFPPNIVAACFEQTQTKYKTVIDSLTITDNSTGLDNVTSRVSQSKFLGSNPSTNVLGLVVFSFLLGLATSSLGPPGRPFLVFFQSAGLVIVKILSWLLWFTPFGVASLIASAFLRTGDLGSAIKSLGLFTATTIGCLALHLVLSTVLVYLIFLRYSPWPLFKSLGRPVIVAVTTTSSAIAIPDMLRSLEINNRVDSRVTRFVVPLATAINRDGSCVFIGVSCVFISQLTGKDLNAADIFMLWALITVLSLACPSVPSSSVVSIVIILTSLSIPTELVGLLFATEWLLDRMRSGVNTISHCFACLVTYRFCKDHLPPLTDGVNQEMDPLTAETKSSRSCVSGQTKMPSSGMV